MHVRLYSKAVDQKKRAEAKKQLQDLEVSASFQVGPGRGWEGGGIGRLCGSTREEVWESAAEGCGW